MLKKCYSVKTQRFINKCWFQTELLIIHQSKKKKKQVLKATKDNNFSLKTLKIEVASDKTLKNQYLWDISTQNKFKLSTFNKFPTVKKNHSSHEIFHFHQTTKALYKLFCNSSRLKIMRPIFSWKKRTNYTPLLYCYF